MIPNIFVSSTIRDLHHLRDSIRDTIIELAYNPVLSEYGDVGYLTMMRAEESCYFSVKDCLLAVLIVGKRYGDPTSNGLSVTHNEFRAARNAKIPVLCLIEQEVLTFNRVFDESQSQGTKASFPGMDYPDMTFGLIQEIGDSPYNNGMLAFSNTADAREILKKQLAHLFGALLQIRFDPLKYEVKDILSELKTLRHELVKDHKKESQLFLTATRYMLDDRRRNFRSFVAAISGSVDNAVPQLIKSESLDDFFKAFQVQFTVIGEEVDITKLRESSRRATWCEFVTYSLDSPEEDKPEMGFYLIYGDRDRVVKMNAVAKRYLDGHIRNLFHTFRHHSKSGG